VATALYTAILTDTGSFRFQNTTASSLEAAARLLTYGVKPAHVAEHVYGSHSLRKFRLLGLALGTLQTCLSGNVATMWVTKEMLDKAGASPIEADGFINFPRDIRGVEVAILFKEEGPAGEVKVSLRSKRINVVVSRVAERFQGGGHPNAAGCTLSGSAETVRKLVLKAIAEELERAGIPASASSPSGPPLSKG
jgi:phosphoesterase RecJ-like protein